MHVRYRGIRSNELKKGKGGGALVSFSFFFFQCGYQVIARILV